MTLKKIFLNKIFYAFLFLAVAGGGYAYYNAKSAQSPLEKYKLAKLETGDIIQSVSANGTLNPVVLVSVGAQVSGTVQKLYVDYNHKVKKGQVLMELEPSLFLAQVRQSEANVKSAQAALDLAEANLARSKELFAKEYISKQELDQAIQSEKSARAQLALNQAQNERDRINLSYTIVRSPVSGVIVDRQVDIGQTVAASFQTPTLFKIAQDLSKMQIDSSFAEADIGNIKVGQKVKFTVDAFANQHFKGEVSIVRLNPTTVQNVVTYDVVINVENPELILLPGMTAYVNIAVAQKKDVVMIPNAALRYKPQDYVKKAKKQGYGKEDASKKEKKSTQSATIFVLENGKPKPIQVEIGITNGKMTELASGELKAGDSIIVDEERPENKDAAKPPMRMF